MTDVTSMTIQSQLDKVTKEQEQELWISDEESYVGSSSDEEYETDSKVSINLTENLETVSETPRTEQLPKIESATSVSQSSNCSNERESRKISWKLKQELLYDYEELLENVWKDDADIFSVDTEGECIEKEISEMENLDNIIRTMNIKVKRACEETLFCQCENRKRLEQIVGSNPSETGRLAENTRQFIHLCPKYTKLNVEKTESNECSKSYASLEENESKQNETKTDTSSSSTDSDARNDWEFIDTENHIEDMNDPGDDSDSNPYMLSGEIKEMLLEVEKGIITVEQNFIDNMERQAQTKD